MSSFRYYSLIDLINMHNASHFKLCEIKSYNQTLYKLTNKKVNHQTKSIRNTQESVRSSLKRLFAICMPTPARRGQCCK